MSRSAAAVIPAAGAGRRMGDVPKAMLPLGGVPMLQHTLQPFLAEADIEQIVVALDDRFAVDPPAWLRSLDSRIAIVAGGAQRGDSVRRALDRVADHIDIVLVHDAARPLVTGDIVRRAIDAVADGRGAIAAVPVTDTIHEVDGNGDIIATADRARLWRAQTPQAFPRAALVAAYARARQDGLHATDDAAIFLHGGGHVQVIEGTHENFKITTPTDVTIAEAILARRQ